MDETTRAIASSHFTTLDGTVAYMSVSGAGPSIARTAHKRSELSTQVEIEIHTQDFRKDGCENRHNQFLRMDIENWIQIQ